MKIYFNVIAKYKCKYVLDLSIEVRDGETLFLNSLGGDVSSDNDGRDLKEFMYGTLQLPLVNLEASLHAYVSNICNILSSYFLPLDYKWIVDLLFIYIYECIGV